MIIAAITELKDGTRCRPSRMHISKYISSTYSDLPCNHRRLLTWHLEKMVDERSLYMVKSEYYLPEDTEIPKRKPGPKPKPKPPARPSNVADVALQAQLDAVPDVGPVAVETTESPKRRRGRKPNPKAPSQPSDVAPLAEADGVKGGHVTTQTSEQAQPDAVPDLGPVAGEERKRRKSLSGKPLGRPKKVQPDAVPGVGPVAVEKKKRRRSLSGKPLGRPKKKTRVAAQEPLVA